jgi:hypothetical protein
MVRRLWVVAVLGCSTGGGSSPDPAVDAASTDSAMVDAAADAPKTTPDGPAAGTGGGSYAVTPASLAFEGRGGGLRPPAQQLQVTANVTPLYLKAEVSGAALESASVTITGERTAVVTVQPASPNAVPVGANAASVRVLGCKDPLCLSKVDDSPKTVAVTFTKAPGGISGMPSALTFTQPFGAAAPTPQTISLRDLGDPPLPFTSQIDYQTASGWLVLDPANGNLPATVTVAVTPMTKAATYQANVRFLSNATSLFTLAVTYTVSADFRVTPPTINVVGARGTPTPDQHVSLSDALGLSYPWSYKLEFSDGTGWITVSPPTATTLPADVTISLGPLPDVLTHQAVLRFTGAGMDKLVQITYRTQ